MKSPITIARNISHTQSKGCWLCIHIGFTVIYFHGWWKEWQGIRVELNAPLKSHQRKDKNVANPLGRWGVSKW